MNAGRWVPACGLYTRRLGTGTGGAGGVGEYGGVVTRWVHREYRRARRALSPSRVHGFMFFAALAFGYVTRFILSLAKQSVLCVFPPNAGGCFTHTPGSWFQTTWSPPSAAPIRASPLSPLSRHISTLDTHQPTSLPPPPHISSPPGDRRDRPQGRRHGRHPRALQGRA
jgi:hypothetical protein